MNHRRFKRLCAALPLLLLAIPGGSRSQEIPKQVPVNAQAKPYGTGWECKQGFRQDGVACVAIKLPENAYLSETSHVSGWECRRGYKSDRNSCEAVKCLRTRIFRVRRTEMIGNVSGAIERPEQAVFR